MFYYFSLTHMRTNFWTIRSEVATGDLPGHLIYAIDTSMNLIVFNNKKFLDYFKEIYPSQLTVEKANKSDHLADYLHHRQLRQAFNQAI